MNYIQVKLIYNNQEVDTDTLATMLTAEDFDSFEETPDGIIAYIPENLWDKDNFEKLLPGIMDNKVSLEYSLPLEEKNWNEEWESNFPPVTIAGRCRIRAPFHEADPGMPLELIIEPKMSFGTAHHETTSQVIELQLDMNWANKKVLDMGCGTGILAIVAAKLGAASVLAIDNDNWAFENSIENIQRNKVEHLVKVKLGDASCLEEEFFDIVIANINRNILLQDMPAYIRVMKKGSILLLSGFYTEDLGVLRDKALSLGLSYDHHIVRNNWVAAAFNL